MLVKIFSKIFALPLDRRGGIWDNTGVFKCQKVFGR